MTKAHLIFIPLPGAGHLASAVELCRRLLARDARLSATILTMTSPFPTQTPPSTSPPSPIEPRFISLPQAELPPASTLVSSFEEYISEFAASHKNQVRNALALQEESSETTNRFHLVLDLFCTAFVDLGHELKIPSYVFYTSGAASLALLLHLPDRRTRFVESEPEVSIPGFKNPVPTSGLPDFAFTTSGYNTLMDHANRFRETEGLIVNTFSELESYAVGSIGELVPVYTVGPVLDLKRNQAGETRRMMEIMEWLDSQPESSVVFLCFGSAGAFSEDQVKEIAIGLKQSGYRFLWSLRKKSTTMPVEYTDTALKSVLPLDFWGAVEEGRGIVCGWAPQVEILAHRAVGVFVSHCGWNSTLEGVWSGKPIVAWPLYAEQKTNAFTLVRELGLAGAWIGCASKMGDVVRGDEVERTIRSVMDMDNPVRSRVKEMSEISRATLMKGGSSFDSIGCLIRKIIEDEL